MYRLRTGEQISLSTAGIFLIQSLNKYSHFVIAYVSRSLM